MNLHLCLDIETETRAALLSILRSAARSRANDDANQALDDLIAAVESAPELPDSTLVQVAMGQATDPAGLRITQDGMGTIGVKAAEMAREVVGDDARCVRAAIVLHFAEAAS